MLDKSKIIKNAFLKLGESFGVHNDTRAERIKIAENLLEEITESTTIDTNFLFNAVTLKAPKSGEDGERHKYSFPNGTLGIVYSNSDYHIEGKNIFSKDPNLEITILKNIDLIEFPIYMKNYITYSLAMAIAQSISTYEDKIGLINKFIISEKIKISNIEGLIKTKY